MVDEDASRRKRTSGVLDAIYEAVEEKPESRASDASPFRAAALERLNVPEQVDNLLPITSRRTWMAVLGVGLVIVAFLAYAAVTTRVTAIGAVGRAVADTGVGQVVAADAGAITDVLVPEGGSVAAGGAVASGVDASGRTWEVVSPQAGTVWQQLVMQGGVVAPGAVVATVLPTGSDQFVLTPIDEQSLDDVMAAERVDITLPDGQVLAASVASVAEAPVPAEVAAARTELPPMDAGLVDMVTLVPEQPIAAGSQVAVSFILSESTLLQSMLGLG